MYSTEQEFVQFLDDVDVDLAKGNVDEWLSWVEQRMLTAIQYETEKAYDEYTKEEQTRG